MAQKLETLETVVLHEGQGIRVVLDTNVLLSLWVFSRSPAGSRLQSLRNLIENGQLQAWTRSDCLAEFKRVLNYPEFALSRAQQAEIFAEYQCSVQLFAAVEATDVARHDLPRCKDPDDQKFLELAVECQAALLLTSDKALLKLARHRRIGGRFRILAPDIFLRELLPEQAA